MLGSLGVIRARTPARVLNPVNASRIDFGSRPGQQQSVLRAYAGHRAEAVAEPARTTDTARSPRGGGTPDPDEGSLLSYRKAGRSLRLSLAGEVVGRGLDIRV